MKQNFLTLQYELSAFVGAGTSLLGDIFNLFGSSKANQEQRDYNTNVIEKQRQWALQDIKDQNNYNSPIEQMNRLKQAGLNPNMVYGQGVQGATGTQSQQPKQTSIPSYNPINELSAFANMGTQMAQAINTLAQSTTVPTSIEKTKQDIAVSKLQQKLTELEPGAISDIDAEKKGYDFWHARELKIGQAEAAAEKQRLDTATTAALQQSTITQGLEAAKQSLNATKASEKEITRLDEIISGLKKSGTLQDLDISFRNQNFSNNPIIQGIFQTILRIIAK